MEEHPPLFLVCEQELHPHVYAGAAAHPQESLQSHALLKEQEFVKSLIYEPPKKNCYTLSYV